MENKNKQIRNFAILTLAVILLNLVYISGLSIGFGSAVNIEPGQSIEKSFTLMNKGVNATNLIVEVTIEQGSEYVTFAQGTRYEVPAGEIKPVPAVFKVPASAKPGDVYPVKINFNTLEGGAVGGGSIEFNVGYTLSFDINVMEKVPTTSGVEETPQEISLTWWILGAIAVIIIIVVIWLIIKSRK